MKKKSKKYSGSIKSIINSFLISLLLTLLVMSLIYIYYKSFEFTKQIFSYIFIFIGNFLLLEVLRKSWLKKKTIIFVLITIFIIICVPKLFNKVPYYSTCIEYESLKLDKKFIDVIKDNCMFLEKGFFEKINILFSFVSSIVLFILNLFKKIFRKTTKNIFNQILKMEEKDNER